MRFFSRSFASFAGAGLISLSLGAVAEAKKRGPDEPGLLPARAKGPITIVVSTGSQRLTVYDGDEVVGGTTVSTGVADHPTPHGVFSVIEKQVYHESNLYSSAPMPYMQRLTWSGVALHEGRVTGAPASHGCVRLPAAFAKALFKFTREGARVVIAHDDVAPAPLYTALPFVSPTFSRDVTGSLRPSDAPATQATAQAPADPDGGALPGEISQNYPLVRPAAPGEFGARGPVSVLVQRKTGKIYVRRNFKPIFEAPIEIADSKRPLGLHLFTARPGYARDLAWSALSAPARTRMADAATTSSAFMVIADEETGRKRKRAPVERAAPLPLMESSASEALQRLKLAPGVAARLSALIGPGATFIISDDGAKAKESWAGTNFIALTE